MQGGHHFWNEEKIEERSSLQGMHELDGAAVFSCNTLGTGLHLVIPSHIVFDDCKDQNHFSKAFGA